MLLSEALQIWFCFSYKAKKTGLKKTLNNSDFGKFFVIKIEEIISLNGYYASQILKYPQKFVSILRYADKRIHSCTFYRKEPLYLDKKTLILFDHFFKRFPEIFYNKIPKLCSNLVGRLIFIQGIIVREGSVLIEKYKRTLNKNPKKRVENIKSRFSNQKIKTFVDRILFTSEVDCSAIEFKTVKIITKFKSKKEGGKIGLTFTNILLIGKMASLCRTGKNISIWGIVKKNSKKFQKIDKNLNSNLWIEAISIFFQRKIFFFEKILEKTESNFINFLTFSQDSKIKGNEYIFIRKIFSKFLSRKFSNIFKISILLSFLGGSQKKSFYCFDRGSINICFMQNDFNCFYNLFYQIRKIFKNSLYILTNNKIKSEFLLCKQKVLPYFTQRNIFDRFLRNSLILFIDYIDFSNFNKSNLLYSLTYKNVSKIFYKGNCFKIKKPYSVLVNVKFNQFFPFNKKKNQSVFNLKNLLSFFDVIIHIQEHIFISKNTIIPFFSPLQNINEKFSHEKFKKFSDKYDLKSLSINNISKYLSYVKSFKNPAISIGAEQLMILWYLSEFCKKVYSNPGIFFLEKLIKFAQANTKLYNRDIVLVQDTLLSISILEKFFFNSSFLKNQNLLRKKPCNDGIRGNRTTNRFKLIETFKATIKINTCNSNINF